MSEWQPIETLPYEEMEVLFYRQEAGQMFVEWSDKDASTEMYRKAGYTHWHPLPEPPK